MENLQSGTVSLICLLFCSKFSKEVNINLTFPNRLKHTLKLDSSKTEGKKWFLLATSPYFSLPFNNNQNKLQSLL